MKKYVVLFLCLIMCVPAFANTVKQNNYSEQLNTQEVNDFVTKKVKVQINEVENTNPEEKINAENSSLNVQKKWDSAVESAEMQINETTDTVVNKAKETQQQAKVKYKSSREAYIEAKEKNIETLRQKQDQLSAYYDSKISEIEVKMQKIKESSTARTAEQKETIVSLYKKSIDSWKDQKDKACSAIQDEIDILQTEVNTLKNKK